MRTYQRYVSGYPKGCRISRLFDSRGQAVEVLCHKLRVSTFANVGGSPADALDAVPVAIG